MPTPSNSPGQPNIPRRMPRLLRAARALKALTIVIVLTFVCAYARTALRYNSPRPQTTASIAKPTPLSFFAPTRPRAPHRRPSFFRPAHQLKRHARRSNPYYLASLRRIRRLFSQLLVVRS